MAKPTGETTIEDRERELQLHSTQTLALVEILAKEEKRIEKFLKKHPENVQKALYMKHLTGIRTYLNNYLQRSLKV